MAVQDFALPWRRARSATVAWHLPTITAWRVLAIVTTALTMFRAVHPFVDIDLYWHVALGDQIVRHHSVDAGGVGWSFTNTGHHWVTTQWLSEVVLALLHRWGGWGAIAALRIVVALVVSIQLAFLLLRRRSPWAAVVYVITLVIAAAHFQERPQLFSLMLLVWLASVMQSVLVEHRVRRPVVVIALTWLWANLHGLWVMVPAALGLVALAAAIQWFRDRDKPMPTQLAAITGATVVVAMLTPAGPTILTSPFTFASATRHISEWQPTNFHNALTIAFALLVALLLVAWARSTQPVPSTEIWYALGITASALMAFRSVPPAAILLAPVVANRLIAVFPRADRLDSAREAMLLRVAAVGIVTVGAIMTFSQATRTSPIPNSVPVSLAERIDAAPGDHRVLDDYNASGAIIEWGGPHTQVYIDGRADRYGAKLINRYSDLVATRGQWQQTLAGLDVNYALLERTAPLTRVLVDRGWHVVATQGKFALLVPRGNTNGNA